MISTYHTFRTTARGGRLGPRLGFTNKSKVVNKVTKKSYPTNVTLPVKTQQSLDRPITGPEGSRRLRLPDFETVGKGR